METIEDALQEAGLRPLGPCERLSQRGPQLLHRCVLMEGFNAAEADILGEAMVRVRAEPGQLLIREGDVGDWMLVLLGGTVDVTKRAVSDEVLSQVSGEASRLSVLRIGATFGEMSMLDGQPRYASCTALEPVEAGVLSRRAIARLIREHPAVGAKLLLCLNQQLAQRLRNTSTQLIKALQKAAAARPL